MVDRQLRNAFMLVRGLGWRKIYHGKDGAFSTLQSDDYIPGVTTSTRPGAGGERVFRFRADRPGEGTLQLELRRSWEDRAVDQVEVPVTVE